MLLNKNHILLEKVSANLTHLFQSLDMEGGPNRNLKRFRKEKFTLWFANQVTRALGKDKTKDVEIILNLLIVKPLHAKWLIEIYNHTEERDVCSKDWKVVGIWIHFMILIPYQ